MCYYFDRGGDIDELKNYVYLLNSIFEKEPKHLWRCYNKQFLKNSKWCITSDYCLDAENKNNNCFAYTIFPYIDFNFLQEKINLAIPKDMKNVGKIDKAIVDMLKNSFFYNIVFIVNDKSLFYKQKNKNLSERDVVKFQIKNTYEACLKIDSKIAKKFKLLLEEAKKNNFNKKLYSNIFWNAFFAAYINDFINKYAKRADGVIWISDRDNMCSYVDGLLFDLYNFNTFSIYNINKTKISRSSKFLICKGAGQYYNFDKIVRIPDYFAGVVSSTDFIKKTVDKNKHLKINEEVIADNSRLVIIELFVENDELRCRKIKLNKI